MKHPKIEVTKEHIRLGKRKKVYCCPVALALKDATGLDLRVGGRRVTLKQGQGLLPVDLWLPFEVRRAIYLFDIGATNMSPFSFSLKDLP